MNEAGSTSIQEDSVKATKGTEESKQVDTKSNHGEETKESKHVEPETESSVQVKVEKLTEILPTKERGRPSKRLLKQTKESNFLKYNRR